MGQVREDEDGCRTDQWLAVQLGLPRRQAQRLCSSGLVTRAGRLLSKGEPLKAGDTISVADRPGDAAAPAWEVPIDVVHESADLIVVNKPAGLACAALPGRTEGTLAGALLARYPELQGVGFGPRDPGLLHRLDTFTSGLVVAARNQPTFEALRKSLEQKQWDKRYLALVETGHLNAEGDISLPLAPDPKNKKRVRVDSNRGVACSSSYRVVQRSVSLELVEVRARAAYRHQVRAHLAALGAPLIGDLLYGGAPYSLAPRHALHAYYIAIPTAGLDALTCDLPEDLRVVLGDAT